MLWVVFSTLLYLTEKDNHQCGSDDPFSCQNYRFGSVPNSLQYTIVLLSGDFPIVCFTTAGRAVCSAIVIAAVGLVAIPSSLICDGFCELQQEQRKERKRKQAGVRSLDTSLARH